MHKVAQATQHAATPSSIVPLYQPTIIPSRPPVRLSHDAFDPMRFDRVVRLGGCDTLKRCHVPVQYVVTWYVCYSLL